MIRATSQLEKAKNIVKRAQKDLLALGIHVELFAAVPKGEITPQYIAQVAAGIACISYDELMNGGRNMRSFLPRSAAMLLTRRILPWCSYENIAALYGKHFTTVRHAISAAQDMLDTDESFAAFYHRLEKHFENESA